MQPASAITTFAWNEIPAETAALGARALELASFPRHTEIGVARMRRQLERFAAGDIVEGARCASIADIHGNVEGLRRELTFCRKNGVTDLVCTGDLIDRDPHSIAVIMELQAAQKLFSLITLLGNHDLFFMRAMLGSRRDFLTWVGNGGMTVLAEAEVGLGHWARWADEQAARSGMRPLQWIRHVLPLQREELERMHFDVQCNECLQQVFSWMRDSMHLSHLSDQGLLHVHAGIPTKNDGSHNLHYRSGGKVYAGLWALGKAEEDFLGAVSSRLSAHPVYDFLGSPESPVWIRDWERGPKLDFDRCNRLLDSLGVAGIIVGHTVQERIENVHQGRVILGDRGLAMAYQNQPAVVLANRGEGQRSVTTTRRTLAEPAEFESRVERARRFAKRVLEQYPE